MIAFQFGWLWRVVVVMRDSLCDLLIMPKCSDLIHCLGNSMRFGVFSYWCLNLLLRNWSGTRPSLVTDLQTNPQWFLEVINLNPFSPSALNSQQTTKRAFAYCMKKVFLLQRCKAYCMKNKGYATQVIKHSKNTTLSQCGDHSSLHLSAVKYTLTRWKSIRAISFPFSFSVTDGGSDYKSFHCHLIRKITD